MLSDHRSIRRLCTSETSAPYNPQEKERQVVRNILSVVPKLDENVCILDVGGGNGWFSDLLLETFPEGTTTVLEPIERLAAGFAFEKDKHHTWDNQTMPFHTASVDVIILRVTCHHMSDDTLSALVKECKRVLRPGGQLWLKEHNVGSDESLRDVQLEHHFYFICDVALHPSETAQQRIQRYIDNEAQGNFKSREQWSELFCKEGDFQPFVCLTRFGELANNAPTEKRAAHLYWELFVDGGHDVPNLPNK